MQHVSKLSTKGQVTIPADLRKAIGIEPGDIVAYELQGKSVKLKRVEPFDAAFTADQLLAGLQGKKVAIKQALLAGHIVVGVGNIYASESLFRARIHPQQAAGEISRPQAQRLVVAIRETLTDALNSGGSTLRDYVNSSGEPGAYFTLHAAVYEKKDQPCQLCTRKIRRIVQGQRATYFCPGCQRLRKPTRPRVATTR